MKYITNITRTTYLCQVTDFNIQETDFNIHISFLPSYGFIRRL